MKLHGYQDTRCTTLDGFATYVKDGDADSLDTLMVRRGDRMHGEFIMGEPGGIRLRGLVLEHTKMLIVERK